MVRTYWLVPVFYEASGNLDLQPHRTGDHVEACRPRALRHKFYLRSIEPHTYGQMEPVGQSRNGSAT